MNGNIFKTYRARASAKINLSLIITGKRENLHELDMILCGVDLYDEAAFVPSDKSAFIVRAKSDLKDFDEEIFKSVSGGKISAAAEKLGINGEVFIKKNVPWGSGLGGSSSAIAAAIKAMQAYKAECGNAKCATDKSLVNAEQTFNPYSGKSYYEKFEENRYERESFTRLENRFLLSLGSDVPYALNGGMCKVRGTGEILEPLDFKNLYFLVLLPEKGVNSAEAYACYDKLYEENLNGKYLDKAFTLPPRDADEALFAMKNDLEDASVLLNRDIARAKAALIAAGADKVIMSGAGSAVAAVFERKDARDRVAAHVNFDSEMLKLKSVRI